MKDSVAQFLLVIALLVIAWFKFIYEPQQADIQRKLDSQQRQRQHESKQKEHFIKLYYDSKTAAEGHINKFLDRNIKLVGIHCGTFERYFTLSLTAPPESSIDAMLFGLTIKDKLGQEIFKGDLRSMESIPAGETIKLSWETSQLCNFRLDQLVTYVSKPFGRFKRFPGQWDSPERYSCRDQVFKWDDNQ